MTKSFILILLSLNLLYGQTLNSLLEEYETNTQKSLHTIDEKLGNVTIYSQKDLRLMQYTTLSDLLKELPVSNLNKNKFGASNLSLPGSKTDVSGFFRIFINNHEVSSNYTMSPTATWMELPMDMVDYIEVYRGNSSFALGSENGIFFIRIYTKKASKENASRIYGAVTDNGSNLEAFSYSETLENGWSYLAYLSSAKINNYQRYKYNKIKNDSNKKYLYLNIEKEDTDINIAYSYDNKENYFGLSLDADLDYGKSTSQDFFVDYTGYFLNDNSLKLNLSYDFNKCEYKEINNEGLALIPVIDFSNPGTTIPKEYYDNKDVTKTSALVSKTIKSNSNNLLLGLSFQEKKYTMNNSYTINFANVMTYIDKFSGFDKEKKYSLFVQDDYKVNENFLLVLNGKLDKYVRNNNLKNIKNEQYRIGAIYTINENFGLKTFHTKTNIAPSFYTLDFADKRTPNLDRQRYIYSFIEGIYADDDIRFSILYNDIKIKDFIYYSPIGYINVDHTIKSKNLILDIVYELSKNNTFYINYYTTKLSEHFNNSYRGGFVKLTGEQDKFEYFTSLVYRNGYSYYSVSTDDSFNFNMGLTYKVNNDISISIKAENILDDSTKSLYKEGFIQENGNFALEDYEREITLSTKWVF
ncbi:TonB-dependent receptor plug domain-containing protein [Sulfurimonas lithotrophica]|uniref:TonB-dependent receptor plug domain-containing protein n=1 Tax=Sulfurimonas lithotrophica TaxID=2590022 RepID=UPI00165F4B7D|nr:TonB-dependent receptor [Sulfurimonas lithotrophica]